MIKARSGRRETRDNEMMSEKLCELVRSGPEVGLDGRGVGVAEDRIEVRALRRHVVR